MNDTHEVSNQAPPLEDYDAYASDAWLRAAIARARVGWIEPAGAVWAVWPKGRKDLNENHVREAAFDAGLVDVKVVRFSATHSGLKLVIPKAKRGRADRHT